MRVWRELPHNPPRVLRGLIEAGRSAARGVPESRNPPRVLRGLIEATDTFAVFRTGSESPQRFAGASLKLG